MIYHESPRRIETDEDSFVSDASHCVVMCCHSYFIEKLISPFVKHTPVFCLWNKVWTATVDLTEDFILYRLLIFGHISHFEIYHEEEFKIKPKKKKILEKYKKSEEKTSNKILKKHCLRYT